MAISRAVVPDSQPKAAGIGKWMDGQMMDGQTDGWMQHYDLAGHLSFNMVKLTDAENRTTLYH